MPESLRKLAVLPARGGSKRIPRKNILEFEGKPIIHYPIAAALASGLFDSVMVSTDDDEIAAVAERAGATVPFRRSEKNADDHATLADVLIEVERCFRQEGQEFDLICCILPTTPLLTAKHLQEGLKILERDDFEAVSGVVRHSHPVLRSLRIDSERKLSMRWPEHTMTRSQDLEPLYYDSGTFYWIRTESLLRDHSLYPEHGGALILDEMEVQDIDSLEDLELARLKYRLKN